MEKLHVLPLGMVFQTGGRLIWYFLGLVFMPLETWLLRTLLDVEATVRLQPTYRVIQQQRLLGLKWRLMLLGTLSSYSTRWLRRSLGPFTLYLTVSFGHVSVVFCVQRWLYPLVFVLIGFFKWVSVALRRPRHSLFYVGMSVLVNLRILHQVFFVTRMCDLLWS